MKKPFKNKKNVGKIALGLAVLTAGITISSRTIAVSNMDFDQHLSYYLEHSGYGNENYVVSPTSLRFAMGLMYEGGNEEARKELLEAMDFDSEEEMLSWSNALNDACIGFNGDAGGGNALIVNNAVWNNTDVNPSLSEKFTSSVLDNWHADTYNIPGKDMTEQVNDWVNTGTKGRIKSVGNDLSGNSVMLLNTVYLNSEWCDKFKESDTEKGLFRTANFGLVSKDFMEQTDDFLFYENLQGKMVVLPMRGGVRAVFVLGDLDYKDAMSKAHEEEVHVRLPKFDIDSSFEKKVLVDFCKAHGANIAFDDAEAFTGMTDDATPMKVSYLMQSANITVYEGGVEAAAATQVPMIAMAAQDFTPPKQFNANKPFKFYICTGENNEIVLFEGQYVK